MVVTGEGRDAALEDGQLRDPPLEDAPPVPTITTAGATTAVAGEEAEKAQIFEVYQEQVCSLYLARGGGILASRVDSPCCASLSDSKTHMERHVGVDIVHKHIRGWTICSMNTTAAVSAALALLFFPFCFSCVSFFPLVLGGLCTGMKLYLILKKLCALQTAVAVTSAFSSTLGQVINNS